MVATAEVIAQVVTTVVVLTNAVAVARTVQTGREAATTVVVTSAGASIAVAVQQAVATVVKVAEAIVLLDPTAIHTAVAVTTIDPVAHMTAAARHPSAVAMIGSVLYRRQQAMADTTTAVVGLCRRRHQVVATAVVGILRSTITDALKRLVVATIVQVTTILEDCRGLFPQEDMMTVVVVSLRQAKVHTTTAVVHHYLRQAMMTAEVRLRSQ